MILTTAVSIGLYIGDKLAEKIIQDKFSKWMEKFSNPLKEKLSAIIEKTQNEFLVKYPKLKNYEKGQVPFWGSQIIIDKFLEYRYYGKEDFSEAFEKLKTNENIVLPTIEELKDIINIFVSIAEKDEKLKEIEREIGYKEEIYKISENVSKISNQISKLDNKLDFYKEKNIENIETFWKRYSFSPKYTLTKELLLSGRNQQFENLINLLQGNPQIIIVSAQTQNEAIAFISACIIAKYELINKSIFEHFVIVDDIKEFKEICKLPDNYVIIPKFQEFDILNDALINNKFIILPVDNNTDLRFGEKIEIPRIDKDGFVSELEKMKINRDEAQRLAQETLRNITILKRLLKFTEIIPDWANNENTQILLPALLIEKWDENYDGDKEIIATLSEMSYENYIQKLNVFKIYEDAPIIQIGTKWKITSTLDTWHFLSKYLTKLNFENLKTCFQYTFNEKIDFSKSMIIYNNKPNQKYSEYLKEGILQSLIFIACFGDSYKLPIGISQNFVDELFYDLFEKADLHLIKSLNYSMPLIAEASPEQFLSYFEKSFNSKSDELKGIFEEKKSFITPITYHTGILWGLEGIASNSEYLCRATLVLANLAKVDPGGSIINRPLNSLKEIYVVWFPQTDASFEERLNVLQLVTKKLPEIAWKLLISILPKYSDHTSIIHKTKFRWRSFEVQNNREISRKEAWNFWNSVIDLLLNITNFDETKLSILIQNVEFLQYKDRQKIYSFLTTNKSNIIQKEYLIWHDLRKTLYYHRYIIDTKNAFSEDELKIIENLYNLFEPDDIIQKCYWLFEVDYPEIIEGLNRKLNYEQKAEIILNKRTEAIEIIYKEYGIDKILELSKTTKYSYIFGDVIAYVINKENEINQIFELLKSKIENSINTIIWFVYRKKILNGFEWIKIKFEQLKTNNFTTDELVNIFTVLPQNVEFWDFIETTEPELKEKFWKVHRINHFFENIENKIYYLKKLVLAERYFSAMEIASYHPENLPSLLIIEILKKAINQPSIENARFDEFRISELFKTLDNRSDIEKNTIAQLEWAYLPLFSGHYSRRKPKTLHNELCNNPEFLIEVLKWIYKSENEEENTQNLENFSEEFIRNRARTAYELLNSWKRIPGVDKDFKIDNDHLKSWIKKVRELAENINKLDKVDMYIGKILAQYPETIQPFPPEIICEIIDEINSKSINDNYYCGLYNKNGGIKYVSAERERKTSEYYEILSKKYLNSFPVISSIFKQLAKSYLAEAKREDENSLFDDLNY